jgi:hypothetical protein
MTLPTQCNIGFKEWAAIGEALAAGRQTIILRKGGIHEGRAGFRVDHREFWLYPTHFHQAAENLTPDAAECVARATARQQQPGVVPLQHLALVREVHELATEETTLQFAGLHVWSEATVRQRFHYRRPGLFLLVARIYSRENAVCVDESAEMAGCKSWVNLPQPIATMGLLPVLSDVQFGAAVTAVRQAIRRV